MKRRKKNDSGWMLLGFLTGPLGIACIIVGALFLVLAVML